MGKTIGKIYERRIDTLKRRRDFLDDRVADSYGKGIDASWDKAEVSAIDWALAIITAHSQYAINLIIDEKRAKAIFNDPQQRIPHE